ncbi:hypothetical protein V2W45_822390 [Cenococcum geophilum]
MLPPCRQEKLLCTIALGVAYRYSFMSASHVALRRSDLRPPFQPGSALFTFVRQLLVDLESFEIWSDICYNHLTKTLSLTKTPPRCNLLWCASMIAQSTTPFVTEIVHSLPRNRSALQSCNPAAHLSTALFRMIPTASTKPLGTGRTAKQSRWNFSTEGGDQHRVYPLFLIFIETLAFFHRSDLKSLHILMGRVIRHKAPLRHCSAQYRITTYAGIFLLHAGTRSTSKRNESCITFGGLIPN